MSIKEDGWIRRMVLEHNMISPFSSDLVREKDGVKVISYGLSSYGYDMRVGNRFQVFTDVFGGEVDPKAFNTKSMIERNVPDHEYIIIPANSFALASSVERFVVPRNVLVLCIGKSTYARCGLSINITPFEPEWEGYVTLEISNTTPLPARVYAGEGICQALFFEGGQPCEVSYADRKGKYQGQLAIPVPPRL